MNAASPETFEQPLDAARLAEAFRVFTRASDELTVAYSGLQSQVGVLTERLDLLLAALPAGVVVLDQAGRVEQSNRAAEDMLGGALQGADWQALAARAFEATDTPGEWALAATGDASRRVSIAATSEAASGGRIILLHDVTEAWRMRVASARNERLAAMGEMVASLAHQLRTPLAAALLYTGHLSSVELAAPQRADVAERAVERLRHLQKLIDDMLIFARGEALGREVFGVCDLVAELSATIEPVAARQGLEFRSDCAAADGRLFGNRKEITGAIINLLENAVQATPAGGEVTLRAELNGPLVCFRVRDTGRGIPPELQARLFEPFYTTRANGTGLGLAIARGVARAHGGDIALDSVSGEGSEFCLALPGVESDTTAKLETTP